jgi:[ribosomal protein S5]-alanine N-acetyltransferase
MIVAMKAPESLHTTRLMLRRPADADLESIFHRYAGDSVATRYLSWPTHRNLADTRAFLAWSDAEWKKWPAAGAYLVFSQEDGQLLGGTGLLFESPTRAVTGYVFAQDAWGHGYATETLQTMVDRARDVGVKLLEAICHVDHRPSAHVLEKCGFQLEDILRRHTEFPNLEPGRKSDVYYYVRKL